MSFHFLPLHIVYLPYADGRERKLLESSIASGLVYQLFLVQRQELLYADSFAANDQFNIRMYANKILNLRAKNSQSATNILLLAT